MVAGEAPSSPSSAPLTLDTPAQARSWAVHRGRSLAIAAVALADLVTLVAASWLSFHAFPRWVVQLGVAGPLAQPALDFVPLQVALAIALLWCYRAYNWPELVYGLGQYTAVITATALATLATDFAAALTHDWQGTGRRLLLFGYIATVILLCGERFIVRRAVYALRRHGMLLERALIVGTSTEAQLFEWTLRRQPGLGYRVVGFIDDQPPGTEVQAGLAVLGPAADLGTLVPRHNIQHIFVARSSLTQEETLEALQHAIVTVAEVAISSDYFQVLATGARMVMLPAMPLLAIEKVRLTGGNKLLKTALDLSLALVLLVLLSPLLLAIAALIRRHMGAPVLDHVPAIGAQGRPFIALKFRTTEQGEAASRRQPQVQERLVRGLPVREYPQVTALGRVLRRYSLDELPQLFNVLRGEMSMVGPYKMYPDQTLLYGRRWLMVTAMKPGITGICQISGRGELTPEERALLDTEYVRNYTIWRDLVLLARTIRAVLGGRGAY
ncbi:MAG TPA: exopolysaccharide biosynthesis polyprenyl glycosylphosphotransferase [Chloroflexota bacterium]|nr:exopolysaccharide biosynthesis polyprenyl glycosylphosphotransferase [Chloroflexota bacterium]